ncbi:hypothetical protein [Humibacillus xanthopallidus]|uniref:Uncharacterized protein n=1 Tax=Humibacillus xanthopallidus TaxID=412689 RepID=A0A543HUX2_9MICO|nr:hypothetical protein [Humibacillus xanthopallidus]TQM62151.1 hypothetical protein FBY41_2179 [Humibacillus xanthopallidus]
MAVLGACGTAVSGSAGDTPTAAVSVTAPTPTASPTSPASTSLPVPPEVAGYSYGDVEADSALPGMAKALVESINQSTPEHKVLKDGEHVLNMLLLKVNKAAAGDLQRPLFAEGLLQWAVGSATPQFSELTLAGQWVGAAHVTVDGQERVALVWPGDETTALVVGRSQREAESFLNGLIKAHTT